MGGKEKGEGRVKGEGREGGMTLPRIQCVDLLRTVCAARQMQCYSRI
jgi:hypothetical protein